MVYLLIYYDPGDISLVAFSISRITLLQLLIAYRTMSDQLFQVAQSPTFVGGLVTHCKRQHSYKIDRSNVASNIDKGIVQQKHNAQKIWKQAAN